MPALRQQATPSPGPARASREKAGSRRQGPAQAGVSDATSVTAIYSTTDLTTLDPEDPSDLAKLQTAENITYFGVYGKVEDPDKALDVMFTQMHKNTDDEKVTLVGDPKSVSPDGLDGAVMKCQEAETTHPVTNKEQTTFMCVWADYSTVAVVEPTATGKTYSMDESAGSPPTCARRSGSPSRARSSGKGVRRDAPDALSVCS
ncbi:hypothetical protein SALBM217S_02667 [Streptomyces griseoloalbus]